MISIDAVPVIALEYTFAYDVPEFVYFSNDSGTTAISLCSVR